MNNEILNTNQYFKTSDLALATILSLYFSVETIEKTNTGKVYFLFRKDISNFDETMEQYWSREMLVEPQSFFNQLKAIKARIYSGE